LIHVLEASPFPERALPSAERLAALVPGSGHIVHMPSHLYVRLGRYHDASLANERAVAVDKRHSGRVPPGPIWNFYTAHNLNFLSVSQMMEGRSIDALAAARGFALDMSLDRLHQMPMMDPALSFPAIVLVRFGRWQAMLEEPAPPPGFRFPTAMWHWARGVALANLGRPDEAEAELADVTSARDATRGDEVKGLNSAKALLDIASTVLCADIADKRGDRESAVALLRRAARAEDDLRYFEPPDWYPPVRHQLGATLLAGGEAGQAEAIYREDLARNPENGWSLFGLAESLSAQGKIEEASQVRARFERAWTWADVTLTSSRF
jgi:tetratricopeptide (TPR) repeat protein